jgi:hypothetical protein
MSSRFGLTVDEALARTIEAERISDEAERRKEIRRILDRVRSLGYYDGIEEERTNHDW